MEAHVKAQEIDQEIIEEALTSESVKAYLAVEAIIHSCDLLLIELRTFNKPETLEKIQELVNKLLEIGTKQKSFTVIVQAYLLHSQLSLMNLECF